MEIQILTVKEESGFDITVDQIYDLLSPPNAVHYFDKLGGPQGMAKLLKSDLQKGLSIFNEKVHPAIEEMAEKSSQNPDAHGLKRRNSILNEESAISISSPEKMTPDNTQARIAHFGNNIMPEPVSRSIWSFIKDALSDKILIMLIVAAFAEIAIGGYKASNGSYIELIDGIAIWLAVMIVVTVTASSDYGKQSQFKKLSEMSKSLVKTKVVRGGQVHKVFPSELLVGDICIIDTGDVLPADGVLIKGYNLHTDESSLTGEPIQILKETNKDPFLLSGSKVVQGIGRMLVIATGVNSLNGRSILALEVEPEKTPLQEKLGRVADHVAYFGIGAALTMFIILLASYLAIADYSDASKTASTIISIFISTITLIVVAVPEGLPLAVVLALSHATVQMLKDNNLVRHLKACETMGNATTICSDKTGTLTMNEMSVRKGIISNSEFDVITAPNFKAELTSNKEDFMKLFDLICQSLNLNSTAGEELTESNKMVFSGSKTEIALLKLTQSLGRTYTVDREQADILEIYPFSSDAKTMCTVVKYDKNATMELFMDIQTPINTGDHRVWLFVKGAAEIVLASCDRFIDSDGKVKPIDDGVKKKLVDLMATYNAEALRTICSAMKPVYRDTNKKAEDNEGAPQKCAEIDHLILLGMFGIADPVRPEVPEAVKKCQNAGITVRMVTGDSVATAKAISKECNILTDDGILMEGHVFRKLSTKEMDAILPKLQVLARSSPLDKQILVGRLKALGETVAVTGDGTNDGPALKAADVGFSMGIAGTEVAKEASDIVLLDDNFASLVRAVIWGRSVFDSVRKFLQFQLSVNISAVVIVFVSSMITSFTGDRIPFAAITAIQLLWVNLIMDTMAALALATDPPSPELLKRLPAKRSEPIISFFMAQMIVAQGLFQILVCLLVYLKGGEWFASDLTFATEKDRVHYISALVFNTFVFCQIYNEINCRSISSALQIIIMCLGGVVFSIPPGGLNGTGWAVSVLLGLGTFAVGSLIRMLPSKEWSDVSSYFKDSEKPILYDSVTEPQVETQKVTLGEEPMKKTQSKRALNNWKRAIGKTQIQMKVIKAFQIPASNRNSISSLNSGVSYRNTNGNFPRESSFVSTIRGGRTNAADYISLQVLDPNEARDKKHAGG